MPMRNLLTVRQLCCSMTLKLQNCFTAALDKAQRLSFPWISSEPGQSRLLSFAFGVIVRLITSIRPTSSVEARSDASGAAFAAGPKIPKQAFLIKRILDSLEAHSVLPPISVSSEQIRFWNYYFFRFFKKMIFPDDDKLFIETLPPNLFDIMCNVTLFSSFTCSLLPVDPDFATRVQVQFGFAKVHRHISSISSFDSLFYDPRVYMSFDAPKSPAPAHVCHFGRLVQIA